MIFCFDKEFCAKKYFIEKVWHDKNSFSNISNYSLLRIMAELEVPKQIITANFFVN